MHWITLPSPLRDVTVPSTFAWSDDFMRVLGLTPTGRASMHALDLNREGLTNLREALHALGHRPPEEQEEDHADGYD